MWDPILWIENDDNLFCHYRKQGNGVQLNAKGIETFTIPCSLEVTLEKAKVSFVCNSQNLLFFMPLFISDW